VYIPVIASRPSVCSYRRCADAFVGAELGALFAPRGAKHHIVAVLAALSGLWLARRALRPVPRRRTQSGGIRRSPTALERLPRRPGRP